MKFYREVSNKKCCRLKHIFQAADVPPWEFEGKFRESGRSMHFRELLIKEACLNAFLWTLLNEPTLGTKISTAKKVR